MKLSAEDSLLYLTCRPYLSKTDDDRLRHLITEGTLAWSYILWRAQAYRTTSVLAYHIRRLNLEEVLPPEVINYVNTWRTISEAHLLTLYRELGTILAAFEKAGIDCFLTKGSALGPLYFPSPLSRSMQDIDLMIHPNDAWHAQRVMLELGFQHGLWNPGTNILEYRNYKITRESLEKYHELPSFTRCVRMKTPLPKSIVPWTWRRKYLKCFIDEQDILTVPVFVDIHVNLSEGIELTDVWRGARREEVLGRLARVHSPTGMLWFVAARLYHEAFQYTTLKLIMFGDAHSILHKRGADIDWTELVTVAKKYGMEPPLYYVLSHLNAVGGADVPEPVLRFLTPKARGIPKEQDWGDVMPKLFTTSVVEPIVLA